MRRYPNLYVIGAPKAGTTALYEILRGSEKVFFSEKKEIHYFSSGGKFNYYGTRWPKSEEEYLNLFKGWAVEPFAGDFSPSYMYSESALRTINKKSPDAKIIVMLREPVSRAVSHHLMDVSKGFYDSHGADLSDMPDRYRYQYILLSSYKKFVPLINEIFSRENVLYIDSSRLKEGFHEEIRRLGSFLELDFSMLKPVKANESFVSRLPGLSLLRSNMVLYRMFEVLPAGLKALIKRLLLKRGRPQAKNESLQELFEGYLAEEKSYFYELEREGYFS